MKLLLLTDGEYAMLTRLQLQAVNTLGQLSALIDLGEQRGQAREFQGIARAADALMEPPPGPLQQAINRGETDIILPPSGPTSDPAWREPAGRVPIAPGGYRGPQDVPHHLASEQAAPNGAQEPIDEGVPSTSDAS